MATFDTLNDWLSHLESIHPAAIDMGLARVSAVRDAMGLRPTFPVVLVGGTVERVRELGDALETVKGSVTRAPRFAAPAGP